jgi:uncharacterized protein (DUF58 family)
MQIIPDLTELLALKSVTHGLTLRAQRPAIARLFGGHASAQRGRGLEFEEVRLYAPGDDARRIDWRVTARRGKPHTKLFREERERPVWIIADLHAGLFFGSQTQFKSAALLRAAAILAWTASVSGDRVGGIVSQRNNLPILIPPRGRDRSVLPMLNALVEAQPKEPSLPDAESLASVMRMLQPILQPGSLVLILSDFSHLNENVENIIAACSAHSDIRLLAFSDPLEEQGLTKGTYWMGLPNQVWRINGATSHQAWQEIWQKHEKRLEIFSQSYRLPLTKLQTTQSMAEILPSLLREPK